MPETMAERSSARLLRAIAEELAQRLLPELRSADARERATLARLTLEYLAADVDVLAAVAQEWAPGFRGALEEALQSLPATPFAGQLPSWRAELAAIAVEHGVARQREVRALRALGAALVRCAADAGDNGGDPADAAAIARTLGRLGALDHQWLTRYEAARRQKDAPEVAASAVPLSGAAPELDPALVTRYLRRRFPDIPNLAASAVVPIPGGRSKKTFFISLAGCETLPAELVMRQDYALRYEGTKVRDEYAPLVKLAALGLAVPRPLLLEGEVTELGPPFIFVERLRGAPPGSYFGMRTPCPGAFAELAHLLAQLHRVAPGELGLSTAAPSGGRPAAADRDVSSQVARECHHGFPADRLRLRLGAARMRQGSWHRGGRARRCGTVQSIGRGRSSQRAARLGVHAPGGSGGGPGSRARLCRRIHALGRVHAPLSGGGRRPRTRAARAPRHAGEFPQRHNPGRHLRAQLRGGLDARVRQGRQFIHRPAFDRAAHRRTLAALRCGVSGAAGPPAHQPSSKSAVNPHRSIVGDPLRR